MKKGLIVALVAMMAFAGNAMAQKTIKLGHIDRAALLQIMPERDSAEAAFQRDAADLQAEIDAMVKEFETKYNDYIAKRDQLSELIRKTKENDLQTMNARIEEAKTTAQHQLEERQAELLKPIIERIKNAIDEVGKENGYTYIFESGAVLYSQDSDDIMPLVKKKLGLK